MLLAKLNLVEETRETDHDNEIMAFQQDASNYVSAAVVGIRGQAGR